MAYTTIKKPSDYFNTKLYTGNGGTQSITGVGFQPDLVWLKERSQAEAHVLMDKIRGVTKRLRCDQNSAEDTLANSLTAFDSDGFSLGSAGEVNENSQTYASWNWKANGAGSANTDGNVTSTVSVNTTSGFSIVSWSSNGAEQSIGHGLGVAPKMIIMKTRGTADGWIVGHKDNGWGYYQVLNGDNAKISDDRMFSPSGGSDPTNSLWWTNSTAWVSGGSTNCIAYCFAEKTGFSKFGSYVSNGVSGDGTFVYTGFKPAFVIHKRTDSAGDWRSWNNKADAFNQNDKSIFPNTTASEYDTTSVGVDFLSNGIKWRQTDTTNNNPSGGTFIYLAFAEEPLIGDNPATAR